MSSDTTLYAIINPSPRFIENNSPLPIIRQANNHRYTDGLAIFHEESDAEKQFDQIEDLGDETDHLEIVEITVDETVPVYRPEFTE